MELYRRVLGFPTSHGDTEVQFCGHDNEIQLEPTAYHRRLLRQFVSTCKHGEERRLSYCFSYNVLDSFPYEALREDQERHQRDSGPSVEPPFYTATLSQHRGQALSQSKLSTRTGTRSSGINMHKSALTESLEMFKERLR